MRPAEHVTIIRWFNAGEFLVLANVGDGGRLQALPSSRISSVSFKNSSRSRPLKLSMKAFWIGLPGAM